VQGRKKADRESKGKLAGRFKRQKELCLKDQRQGGANAESGEKTIERNLEKEEGGKGRY